MKLAPPVWETELRRMGVHAALNKLKDKDYQP